jgi:hypothetical protein
MNIAESNHNSTDLGIPYMDTDEIYLRPKTSQIRGSHVFPNENFRIVISVPQPAGQAAVDFEIDRNGDLLVVSDPIANATAHLAYDFWQGASRQSPRGLQQVEVV